MLIGKRRFGLLMLLMLMLTSAGFIHAQPTPAIAAQPCTTPGKLTMWVWDENWAKIIGASIEDWKTNYCPGAEVDLQVKSWEEYWGLLRANASNGGDMPDVFNLSQDRFYFYASNEALLDLQPYLDAAGVDTTLWGSGMIDPYRWGENNDLHATPVNWDTIAIFYNKDLFDAVGIPYPSPVWDWNGFKAAAAALTNSEQGIYGAAVYSEYQAGYPNWIASTGIPPIVGLGRTQCTLTEASSVEALNFLKKLYDDGYMPGVSTLGGPSADDAFDFWLTGKLGMVAGGSWKLPVAFENATFNWDVVILPKNPDTERSRSILHSVGYVASANSPNPDLAANLILFLSSDEGQAYFADAGGVAPANPALQQQWIDSFGHTDVNIQTFVDAINDSQGVTVFEEIWDEINTELVVNIFDRGMSVAEATQEACDFIEEQLPSVR